MYPPASSQLVACSLTMKNHQICVESDFSNLFVSRINHLTIHVCVGCRRNHYISLYTLPETNSSPLKIGRAPNRKGSYSNHPFLGANSLLVSGRVPLIFCLFSEAFPEICDAEFSEANLIIKATQQLIQQDDQLDVSKNRGNPPKMDGL